MRLGWDAHSIVAPEVARRAEAAGISFVSVHGRTRAQFYTGKADWDAIAAVKAAVSVPLAANGDLTSYEDAIAMRAKSGADAVMIGRAARGRPWFVGQVGHFLTTGERRPEPSLAVQRDVLIELYQGWLSHYGHGRGLREARKHIGWALEAAAIRLVETTTGWVKEWRGKLLAETVPARVTRGITEAFDDLSGKILGWKVAA
jgi:tRNA-dihydrouridine synthase B